MSEQKYAGQLVHAIGNNAVEPLLSWHYEAPDRHCLPENPEYEDAVALVDNELIYQYVDGKWQFNLIYTNGYSKIFNKPGVTRTSEPTVAVSGLDFSSKPRNEWTMGNWIAHVGGSIRSDHFVVFGSVMAVDMMVRQIIRNVLGMKKEGINLAFSGGTEQQRALLATTIAGIMHPLPVNPGYNLQKYIDQQAKESLTEQQSLVIMDAIARSGGINIEFVADKAE